MSPWVIAIPRGVMLLIRTAKTKIETFLDQTNIFVHLNKFICTHMEKELKRKIGYVKPKGNHRSEPIKPTQKAATRLIEPAEKENFDDITARAQAIATWIKDHPYFMYTAMVKDLGMDRGNFYKAVFKRTPPLIKPENVLKIEKVLKNYGYTFNK